MTQIISKAGMSVKSKSKFLYDATFHCQSTIRYQGFGGMVSRMTPMAISLPQQLQLGSIPTRAQPDHNAMAAWMMASGLLKPWHNANAMSMAPHQPWTQLTFPSGPHAQYRGSSELHPASLNGLQNSTSLSQKLSSISNCTGPPCDIVYPSDAVSDDLRCAMGPELWKYGIVCTTLKAQDEAYDVLKEEVNNNGLGLPFTIFLPDEAGLDMDVDVGEMNLALKNKVLSYYTLSCDEKQATLWLLYRKQSTQDRLSDMEQDGFSDVDDFL